MDRIPELFTYGLAVAADGALLWLVARWLARRTIHAKAIANRLNNWRG
jgi:HAMP domain-containing protein